MIDSPWPILLIVFPMMMAPIIVMIGNRQLSGILSTVTCWGVFGIAVKLVTMVAREGRVRYEIGGWEPPYGIEYVVDPFSSFIMMFVSFIAAIVLTYALFGAAKEIPQKQQTLFYASYLLCLTGLLGMCITGDLFNVFVFLEISSLSSYALISMGPTRRAPLASLQYLIVGTIGATFFLIGIGLLYQMTGTLNMADIASRLPREEGSRTLLVALAMMGVGLAIKMAVFPVHTWLPNAYTYAPSIVSSFIAATATKVSVYAFIRLIYTIFGKEFAFDLLPLDSALVFLSLTGIFVASTAAIFQEDVKRLLAFSSVAQIGYMLLGVGLNNVEGLGAGIVHLMNHALIKGGLFMAVGCVVYRLGSSQLKDWKGIGKTMPWTSLAISVGMLALIGVPVTAGFVTKWMLLSSALGQGHPVIAALMLVSSLMAVVYGWKVVETIYFGTPDQPVSNENNDHESAASDRDTTLTPSEVPIGMLLTTWSVIGLTIYFGIWTEYSAGLAVDAAAHLLGVFNG